MDPLRPSAGRGRHARVLSTSLLKRWLLVAPLVVAVLVGALLAAADDRREDALVVGALLVGVVLGVTVVPAGEGRAANPALNLVARALALPVCVAAALLVASSRGYAAGCALACVLTYFTAAAVRIVRRRHISWRSLLSAPWR
jgi:hypothetical protein